MARALALQKPWPLPRPNELTRNEWFNSLTNREQAAASLCICCGSGLGAPSREVASQTWSFLVGCQGQYYST